jgi:hypothetical protein
LEAVFEMPKLENKKKGERAKSGEYGGRHVIRKKLSLRNPLVIFAGYGLALSACATSLLSPLSPCGAMISLRIFRI